MTRTSRVLNTSFVGLRLHNDVRAKLEELARKEDVPLAQIFRWALRDYLAKQPDDPKN